MNPYQDIWRLLPGIYAPDSPVIISEGGLLRDSQGYMLAWLRLRNLDKRTVSAARAEVECLGLCGEDLGRVEYVLEGSCPLGAALEGAPVLLPEMSVGLIKVRILQVDFADGTAWTGTGEPWEPLPAPQSPEEVLQSPELAAQYRNLIGQPCVQAPRMHRGLFVCACGTVNADPEAPCLSCGRTFPALASAMNPARLAAALEEQRIREDAARQRQQELEQERALRRKEEKRQHRKESGKFFLIALVAVILLAGLGWLIPNVVLPGIRNGQAMDQARQLLEQGAYEEASAAFAALGDYKDAPEQARESLYRLAGELREQGRYQESVEQYTLLGDYSDSAAQAEETLRQWKESDYQAARALVDNGAYPAAAAAFEALGDYKDAAQWVVECQMLQREGDYNQALAAMEAGDYQQARELFEGLGEYRDSAQLAQQCVELKREADYAAALALLENKDYAAAEEAFLALGDYEDSQNQLLNARYNYGCQLLQQEEYAAAVEKLELCGNYQNTDWNLKQAKLGYCKTHKDRNDADTLAYLKELKAIYFQGAQGLYDEIFGWKVEITSFSNKEWGENQDALSKYGIMYVHFKLTGGEPGQSLTLRTVLVVPGGNRGTIYHNSVSDGYVGYSSFWFHDPDRAPTGSLTFYAYDEAGRLLGSGSVKVTY